MEETKKEYEHVAKKQKTYVSHLKGEIDNLIESIESLKQQIQNDKLSIVDKPAVASLKQVGEVQKKAQNAHKDFNSQLGKLGKAIDKTFYAEVEKAYRDNWEVQPKLIDLMVSEHLYREGQFKVGQVMEKESGVHVTEEYKKAFMEMYHILEEMKQKKVQPALKWCETRREALAKRQSNLEFMLHKLQFIQLLTKESVTCQGSASSIDVKLAIQYARTHFDRFSKNNMDEIRYLMGSLLYANRLAQSPYKDLLNENLWDDVTQQFKKECCALSGKSVESPLFVAVTAGCKALPTLMRLAAVTESKKHIMNAFQASNEQLHVEIDLGTEFTFHSIFACPVSKEQATTENPPMILPCGHVLLRESILKIVRGNRFKCPYCPQESSFAECRTVSF